MKYVLDSSVAFKWLVFVTADDKLVKNLQREHFRIHSKSVCHALS